MATPHVWGVACLLFERQHTILGQLSSIAVKSRLLASGQYRNIIAANRRIVDVGTGNILERHK